jgi:Protein of unknown function (DUF2897)
MVKAIIIIGLVVALLIGGLLTLRSSARTGMPNREVLERAAKRAREQAGEDAEDEDRGARPK